MLTATFLVGWVPDYNGLEEGDMSTSVPDRHTVDSLILVGLEVERVSEDP